MLRNLKNKTTATFLLAPQTVEADVTSAAQDLQNLHSFAFLVVAGNFAFTTTNKLTLTIEESDDNSAWAAAPVTAYYTAAAPELAAAGAANSCTLVEYRGHKRYVRMVVVEAGVVSVTLSIAGISTDIHLSN